MISYAWDILWDFGKLEEGLQFMENAYHDTNLFGALLPSRASLEYFHAVVQSRKDLRVGFAKGGRPLNLAELVKYARREGPPGDG